MRVILNGLEMNGDWDNNIILTIPISGIGRTTTRVSGSDYSGRDGGYVSSQFQSRREIVLRGLAKGSTSQEAAESLSEVYQATPLRQKLPLYIITDDGTPYFTEVFFVDMNYEAENRLFHKFELILIAPDPNFYIVDLDNPDDGWVEQTIMEIEGGGYVTPYVLPVVWEPSAQPTVIYNPTNDIVMPQIVLEGRFTEPIVENRTTGQQIKLNVTTAPGDLIIIDMLNRSITLNGGSILPARVGNWWGLVEGENRIAMSTDDPADTKEGIVRYRLPYVGVFSE